MRLLRGLEKRLGLAARLAGCLTDTRDPASTTHTYADMIDARLFAIACGYEDCDDLDVLRFDPAFKLACGRLAETGRDLMSQPTLCRLENAPSWRALARMSRGLHRGRPAPLPKERSERARGTYAIRAQLARSVFAGGQNLYDGAGGSRTVHRGVIVKTGVEVGDGDA